MANATAPRLAAVSATAPIVTASPVRRDRLVIIESPSSSGSFTIVRPHSESTLWRPCGVDEKPTGNTPAMADGASGRSPETLAAHGGSVVPPTGEVVAPIHVSTTFRRDATGGLVDGREYSRADSPSYDGPEQLLTSLEGGSDAVLLSSGMAAITCVFQVLTPGDHAMVGDTIYWGTRKWLSDFGATWGLDVEYVDTTDLDAVSAALRPGRTRVVWLETPANPSWEVTDLAAVADLTHSAGARLVVDSTVATPVITRPIEHGADLVVHSATKYLNGHSDVVAGAVVTARSDPFWERIRAWRREAGSVLGPVEAWLLHRGMRTLFVRVRHASATAMRLAEHLQTHPSVASVLYPGLVTHPGHDIASRQMNGGYGGMLSIRVSGGEAAALATATAVQLIVPATSLGGTETLIEHRATVEGPGSPVPRDLLRISVGLEDLADLVADLDHALDLGQRAAEEAPPTSPGEPGPAMPASERVAAVVERLQPTVVARGGRLDLSEVSDGRVTLSVSGSPGAVEPIRSLIEAQVRAADPGVNDVRFGHDAARVASSSLPGADVDAVQAVLDRTVAPSLAAHGGSVGVTEVAGGVVRLQLGGRCVGCAMAEVTVRQGIEPILRDRLPVAGVVDETDHGAATDPYYPPAKR